MYLRFLSTASFQTVGPYFLTSLATDSKQLTHLGAGKVKKVNKTHTKKRILYTYTATYIL